MTHDIGNASAPRRPGFTLVELLVVMGVIAILLGLLFPVVGTIRKRAYDTNTQAWLRTMEGAIEAYYSDTKGWPGVMSNAEIEADIQPTVNWAFTSPPVGLPPITNFSTSGPINGASSIGGRNRRISMSENLTLSLMGGFRILPTSPATFTFTTSAVGQGAVSQNPLRPSSLRSYLNLGDSLSGGMFKDESFTPPLEGDGSAFDTVIPEFVDRFPAPLPILYLRAGYAPDTTIISPSNTNNRVIVEGPANNVAAYSLRQILPYVGDGNIRISDIGENREIRVSQYRGSSTYNVSNTSVTNGWHGIRSVNGPLITTFDQQTFYPYDAYTYFRNPTNNRARGDGRFLLISAGRDRVYGTEDDITNFGRVSGN
jgi:prepilin-type N-terminal cleavage/methylation domain-containing protein